MLGLPIHLPRLHWAPVTDLVLRAGDAELGGESAQWYSPLSCELECDEGHRQQSHSHAADLMTSH